MTPETKHEIDMLTKVALATPRSTSGRKVYTKQFIERAISVLRKSGLTQRAFSEITGIKSVTLSGWINSKKPKNDSRRRMTVDQRLTRVLEITERISMLKVEERELDKELRELM